MQTVVIYDCEFLTADGAMQRFWSGPFDPDPVLAQIGAVRLGLAGDFAILDRFSVFVRPVDRAGASVSVDPHFTELTGITQATLDRDGIALADALLEFDAFSEGAPLWAWGKDEFFALAISCYVAVIPPPIPATRFHNVTRLMLAAGMPYEDVKRTRSNALAAYFGVDPGGLAAHDGLDDALSITYAVQHLLRAGRLSPEALSDPIWPLAGPQLSR